MGWVAARGDDGCVVFPFQTDMSVMRWKREQAYPILKMSEEM
jgi:hypothetical protein